MLASIAPMNDARALSERVLALMSTVLRPQLSVFADLFLVAGFVPRAELAAESQFTR
jgi:hypothetical protein